MSALPSLYPSQRAESKWKEIIKKGVDEYNEYVSKQGPKSPAPSIGSIRSKVVYEIVNNTLHTEAFQTECKVKPNEVYENGSLKQATTVPGNFNLDLVLFSEDLTKEECLKNDGYPNQLSDISKHFEGKFEDKYEMLGMDKTELRFKFILKETSSTIDVKLKLSFFWKSTKDLFDMIAAQDTWKKKQLFFPGTIKLQTEYIQSIDKEQKVCQHIHTLIQRAKAWRDNQDWPTDKKKVVQKPDSYLLSLLVIKAFYTVPKEERVGKLRSYAQKVTDSFKSLIKQLGEFMDCDELDDPRDDKLIAIRDQYAHLLPAPWWLIDPANPANNVYVSGMSGERKDIGWKAFATKVESIDLKKDDE